MNVERARAQAVKRPRGETRGAAPARPRRRAYLELTVLSLVAGIAVWWAAVASGLANPVLMPPPGTVVRAIIEMTMEGTLLVHVGVSLARALGGFLVAVVIGVPIGIVIGRSARAYALVDPWIELFRPVPPIAGSP